MLPARLPQRPLLAAVLLLALLPGTARAQDPSCEFLEGTLGLNTITLAGGARITYLSRPRIGCPDGVRIRADSAISYSAQDMTHLLGNVYFRDGARELRSREARYFPSTGRLQAQGDVRLEDLEDGSIIENGDLVLLRQNEFRDEEELTVTTSSDGVRPRATLFVRAAPDAAAPPAPDPLSADTAAVADTAATVDTVATPDTVGVPDSLPAPAEPGDTVAMADTVLVPDSLAAPAAPSDTVAMADTVLVPDSLPAPAAPGDTVAMADTIAPPSDTLAAGPPSPDAAPPEPGPATPWDVEADRLRLVGEDRFEAVGDAVIQRDSIHATAARADYDGVGGNLVLRGSARLDGPTYDLQGEEIVLTVPAGRIREVTARRNGVLTGDDLRLDAPVIHLFLVEGLLDRLVATPVPPAAVDSFPEPDSLLRAQPVATAEEFVLSADSVDVRAPGQELDRIYAVGTARGVSTARDSLNVEALPELARHDWLEGDTIIATFRPAEIVPGAPGAGGDDYVLEELVAVGSARSLYRLLPSDSTARPGQDPPAVHYVIGSRITVAMEAGAVDRMEVEGPSRGFHLEPRQLLASPDTLAGDTVGGVPPAGALPGDTLPAASPPDTVAPDTLPTAGGGTVWHERDSGSDTGGEARGPAEGQGPGSGGSVPGRPSGPGTPGRGSRQGWRSAAARRREEAP